MLVLVLVLVRIIMELQTSTGRGQAPGIVPTNDASLVQKEDKHEALSLLTLWTVDKSRVEDDTTL